MNTQPKIVITPEMLQDLQQAALLREEARMLTEKAKELQFQARELQSKAIESGLGFGVGNVIEITTWVGVRDRKRVSRKLEITSMRLTSDRKIEIIGQRRNAKLEIVRETIFTTLGDGCSDEFVKVLK
jgi:hypothetical protein